MPETDNTTIHQIGLEAVRNSLPAIFDEKDGVIASSMVGEDRKTSPHYRDYMRINMTIEAMRRYSAASNNAITVTVSRSIETIVNTYINSRLSGNETPKSSPPPRVLKPVEVMVVDPPKQKGEKKETTPPPEPPSIHSYKYPVPNNEKPIAVIRPLDTDYSVKVLSLDGIEQTFRSPDRAEYVFQNGLDTFVVESDDGFFHSKTTFNRKNIIKVSEKRSLTEE